MTDKNQKKIIVGMSGGVDSSVAAWLLKKAGYKVEGLFMKNWEEDDNDDYCHAARDLSDAQSVCNKLNIKLHKINFSAEYWDKVFMVFLKDYELGLTPNPDILCNKEIKFKEFSDFAIKNLGANFIATGHHVRRKNIEDKSFLLRGLDNNKDQSYFLYTLNQKQIKQSLFPIGYFTKLEVRYIAQILNLSTAKKKDSNGICFIGKRNFRDFIANYISAQSGYIENMLGEVIGEHQGAIYYTLGQRKGLKIGGRKNSNGNPWYVVDKDITNNRLIVAQGSNHPSLMSTGVVIQQLHWINHEPKIFPFYCTVKTRYRQIDAPCKIIINNNNIEVHFHQPMSAIAPGQSVVFYINDICLGGGIIKQRLPLVIN
ncbi:tRNA 2-thiouridine(34) synthase MnmA [Pantoea sp. Mhis]|uniref:tRNA 2-thiouridine(34) synthase MnmA n=1 Tax=Pantoea sp. Mhis TaxID=2576759 RepID=UPI001359F6FA|nr:tRNA 2-thiouridine(34) synthase MnmA [Pantoea sp. Mhis]MXP56325.1 tRNA 2-thiouridine(34) synthase MnmA [Pantoea sp. Mhis]